MRPVEVRWPGEIRVSRPALRLSQTGEINPLIAALIEDLPPSGEWTRDEHDLWARVFLRTVDKLYKVKE